MAMYPRDRTSSAGRVDHYPFTVFHRAFKENSTCGTCSVMAVPTATRPAPGAVGGTPSGAGNNGIHELQPGTKLIVIPYGGDNNDDEFRISVQFWHPVYDRISAVKESEDVVWVGTLAAIVDCTIITGSNAAVVAADAGPLTTGDYFCEKILLPTGTTQPGVSVKDVDFSNGDAPTKVVADFTVETNGAKYVQFYVDVNGGAGTGANQGNALFAVI